MPHSSGGGSHGGGSHGGSSHSSSHGGSGGRSYHSARRYFPGSTRYVYYRHNRPEYVYADYDITGKRSKLRYLILLFYVPFLFAVIMLFATGWHHPKKLPQDYDYRIIIEDNADVLEDEATLKNSLVAFYNRTGISPAVITVNNSDWQNYYSDLENYAYDLYVNHFSDESHWLIVYSQPENASASGFVDWYWEGMQGDDTDDILTTSVTDDFNNELHKDLTASTRYTVSSAISTAFDSITPTVMKTSVDGSQMFAGVFMLIFICVHAFFMVGFNPKSRYYENAQKCPEYVQERTCEYCGNIYVAGTCTQCPHCGAVIPPEYQQPNADFAGGYADQYANGQQNVRSDNNSFNGY